MVLKKQELQNDETYKKVYGKEALRSQESKLS